VVWREVYVGDADGGRASGWDILINKFGV
jgi:hypothetical protein